MGMKRSRAARDATITTAGRRNAVVLAARAFCRAKTSRRGVEAATEALMQAVAEYDKKPDFSWYSGQVDREVVRKIVRLKREGKFGGLTECDMHEDESL